MFISRLFALATAGLASLSLVAATPIAAPPAPGTQELDKRSDVGVDFDVAVVVKRSNADYVYNTLLDLSVGLDTPIADIYAAVKVGGVTKEILDVHVKLILSLFDHAVVTLQTIQPGDKEPYTPKHKECANLIVVIITKVVTCLHALLYLVIKVPELLTWFVACDKAISSLVILIDGILYNVLAIVSELLAAVVDIKVYLGLLNFGLTLRLYL